MENSDKYVKTHWEQLEIALEQAKKVSADGDALQDEVDEAANALQEAIWIQRYKANKEILEELVKKLSNVDESEYTRESYAVFFAAYQNAEMVLADESLTEKDQKVVDKAAEELQNAYEKLEKLSDNGGAEDPEKPDDSKPDDSKPDDSKPDDSKPDTSKPETPTTGDNSMNTIMMAAAGMAVAGMMVVFSRKKKQCQK